MERVCLLVSREIQFLLSFSMALLSYLLGRPLFLFRRIGMSQHVRVPSHSSSSLCTLFLPFPYRPKFTVLDADGDARPDCTLSVVRVAGKQQHCPRLSRHFGWRRHCVLEKTTSFMDQLPALFAFFFYVQQHRIRLLQGNSVGKTTSVSARSYATHRPKP